MSEWSVQLADEPIAGGSHLLELRNAGVLQHELVLIATEDPTEELPIVSGMVDTRGMSERLVGELAELLPGEEVTVPLELEPGTYTAFCNIPGHYSAGMHTTLVVDNP